MHPLSLEFTTTACNRPEILEQTYHSFSKKLKNVDFTKSTLYINIDPSPSKDNISEVINVARKYFGNVIYNIPNEPNFAQAILWCFQQVKGEYFFHLEDDWILLREVNIHNMVHVLQSPNVSQCILNKKNINPKEIYEPAFIPSLFMTKIVKVYLQFMNNESNPEAQMKNIFRSNVFQIQTYKSKFFAPHIELSRDIGREWLKSNGIKRDYDKHRTNHNQKWTPWTTWKIN